MLTPLHAGGYSPADLVMLAFAVLIMPGLSARAGAQLSRIPRGTISLVPRYRALIVRGWVLAITLVIVWRVLGRSLGSLGLDIPVSAYGLIGLAIDAVIATLLAVQLLRMPKLEGERLEKAKAQIDSLRVTPRTPSELLLFIPVSITAGVWEELLYRGFLIWFLEPLTGTIGAVLLSSAIFGLGHVYQGWRGVRNTALVGLVFAVLFVLTRSLWWLMLAHALVDIYGGVLAYRLTKLYLRATASVNIPSEAGAPL